MLKDFFIQNKVTEEDIKNYVKGCFVDFENIREIAFNLMVKEVLK